MRISRPGDPVVRTRLPQVYCLGPQVDLGTPTTRTDCFDAETSAVLGFNA